MILPLWGGFWVTNFNEAIVVGLANVKSLTSILLTSKSGTGFIMGTYEKVSFHCKKVKRFLVSDFSFCLTMF